MSATIISLRPSNTQEVNPTKGCMRLEDYMAIHISYKMPFVVWLNTLKSKKDEDHTLESANQHSVVLLVKKTNLGKDAVLSEEMKCELFDLVLRYWTSNFNSWIDERHTESFDEHFGVGTIPLVVQG